MVSFCSNGECSYASIAEPVSGSYHLVCLTKQIKYMLLCDSQGSPQRLRLDSLLRWELDHATDELPQPARFEATNRKLLFSIGLVCLQ